MTDTVAHFEELLNTVPRRLVDFAEDAVARKPHRIAGRRKRFSAT